MTSHTMKVEFAYQPHVGEDDAIIYMLQKAHSALHRPGIPFCINFFDFASFFNTNHPRLLKAKLEGIGVESHGCMDRRLLGRQTVVC